MKKLMAMFAICVSVASTPSWALFGLGDTKFDGSLEVSGNAANNEADFGNVVGGTRAEDHRGNTATRVRVGMNTMITEGVTGRLELVRTPRLYGSAATTVTTEQALWTFQNAYADINNLWGHDFRLGRQYVGENGDLVWHIGPKADDSMTVTAIDGLLAQCAKGEGTGNFWDKIHLMAFFGKASEDDAIANTNRDDAAGDINLSDIEAQLNVIPNGRVRIAYLIGKDENTSATADNNSLKIYRVGVNGGVAENMFTYRAELLGNMGEFQGAGLNGSGGASKLKYQGSAIDLGGAFNSKDSSIGSFGIWLNYVMASGDDNVTDDKDKSFHDFSMMGINTSDRYFGEIYGKSNTQAGGTPHGQGIDSTDSTGVAPNGATQGQGTQVFNIGAQYKPAFAPKSWLRLDYYTFSRAEDSVKTAANTNTNVKSKIGDEIDLTLGYNHTENVGLEFGYAMFSPGDAILIDNLGFTSANVGSAKDDASTKLFARANIKWGGEEK